MNSICPMIFFRTTDTTIWKPGLKKVYKAGYEILVRLNTAKTANAERRLVVCRLPFAVETAAGKRQTREMSGHVTLSVVRGKKNTRCLISLFTHVRDERTLFTRMRSNPRYKLGRIFFFFRHGSRKL